MLVVFPKCGFRFYNIPRPVKSIDDWYLPCFAIGYRKNCMEHWKIASGAVKVISGMVFPFALQCPNTCLCGKPCGILFVMENKSFAVGSRLKALAVRGRKSAAPLRKGNFHDERLAQARLEGRRREPQHI